MIDFEVIPTPALHRAQILLEEYVLPGYNPECNSPRHGPGAVAGGERKNNKWKFSTLYLSMHQEWPYYEYLFGVRSAIQCSTTRSARSLPLQLAANASLYRAMRRVEEPTARMLFVPKDSRGPRIISCEPKELMYVQQGVARHLMSFIERCEYTRGHVNFVDQSINANLALEASASRRYATIDLSDASDRVSTQLVTYLYPRRISKKWLALRSTATLLPSGEVLPLRKFAPMGSALCFPVESLTFWAIAVGCVWEHTGDLRRSCDSVYVYGDDIIVADEYNEIVVNALESVFLKVNRKKTFAGNCPFRESCGTDGLKGQEVTPLRIRVNPPQRPSDGTAIAAWIMYAQHAIHISPRRSAACLRIVESLIGRIPRTLCEQQFISIVDPTNYWEVNDFSDATWDPSLCYYVTKQYTLQQRKRISAIAPYARLQNNLILGTEGDPSLVVDRSSTQIRKRRCFISYAWRTKAG